MKNGIKRYVCIFCICMLMSVLNVWSTEAMAACSHSRTWPRIGFSVGGPKDSSTHYIYGSGWYECSDCGAQVESIFFTQDAAHEFNSSGKCSDCGYSCPHYSTSTSTGTKKYEAIAGNSTHHHVITPYYYVCNKCGKRVSDDKKVETALHSFSGSKCTVCGYTKVTQSNTQSNTKYNSYTNSQSSYTSGSIKINSNVTASKGEYTIKWSGGSSPYQISYKPANGKGQRYGERGIYNTSCTTSFMIPGLEYSVTLTDSTGASTTQNVYVPSASSYRDGNISAGNIEILISPRKDQDGNPNDGNAVYLKQFNASEMKTNMTTKGWAYGLFYRFVLPQGFTERTYLQNVVFTAPNGYSYIWCSFDCEHKYYGENYITRWLLMGTDFFETLLEEYDRIPVGRYTVDLYWDGMHVNTTQFQVN